MGKKARKTRWRTLSIAGEESDSEESNITIPQELPQSYQQKPYHYKPLYSSKSAPKKRYQYNVKKSTRSNSTASENKITFNEDEYTRITTPRQDVLFKKGYLNKPRSYQTQTSTSTSTNSTGNSTGNGTPDEQLTDLDYESQFVFPNGFVDQNGIYFLNSFETYPLMLYNPSTYYDEFSNCKSKRCSTGSLTESTSPNNEEATNHDSSAGEASNNVTDHFSNHSDYNMVHPGYYVNEVPHPQDVAGQCKTGQIRMIKKRKRRKTSRTQTLAQESTECSDEESDENTKPSDIKILSKIDSTSNIVEFVTRNEETNRKSAIASDSDPKVEHQNFNNAYDRSRNENDNSTFINIKDGRDRESVENKNLSEGINSQVLSNTSKYNLKPDAEEFIPRVHQTPEMPLSPVQFIKIPPNLLTMPVLPFNAQNFNTAFIPPGMPIEFVHTDPKLFSNFISFVSNAVISDDAKKSEIEVDKIIENHDISASNESNTAQDKNYEVVNSGETVNEEITKNMDLNKIVSKLKEAMKKQEKNEVKTDEYSEPTVFTKKIQVDNQLRDNQKYKTNTYKKSFHNNSRNSLEGRAFPKISKYSIRTDSTEIQDVSHGNSQKEIHTENGNIRSSYEHKNYWKSQYEDDATKWQSHVIHRNIELKPQNENIHSVSEVATGTKQNVMGVHSEILESKVWNGKEEDSETNVIKSSSSPSTVAVDLLVLSSKNSSTLSNHKNQWIPVSSRKKRKNKTTEGNDSPFDNVENELSPNDNLFESYDVNLLVDVVPTSKKDIMEIEINDGNAKEIISETEPNSENIQLLSSMKYVTEIENEIIAKKSEKREEAERPNEFKKSKDSLQLENPQKLEDCQQFKKEINFPESLQNELTPEMTMKVNVNKYRNKKKRVIITDIGLSDRCEGVNVQENENVGTVVKVEDKFIVSGKTMKKLTEMSEVEENNAKLLSAVKEHTVNSVKNEKKSSKKKKKKSTNGNSSSSTPAASALNLVDSYDYLLESSSINEPDKTNDDVSQELDRIIQKGIFSSLEGKIKSMNIDESEGFFKSVFSRLSSKEDSVEKAGYLSTPDFTKIPLIKPMTVSEAISLENMKANNEKLPTSESPEEDGFFLENPDSVELLKNRKTNIKGTNWNGNKINEVIIEGERKTLYPITEAVKEWMSKTRETTPEIEILKSPRTIYKELCESDDDNEITVFSTYKNYSRKEGEEQNILYYQENEVECTDEKKNTKYVLKQISETVDQSEDVMEFYESRYGKNEDFLNLQNEVREKTSRSRFPKHGNLPFRAICCNIM